VDAGGDVAGVREGGAALPAGTQSSSRSRTSAAWVMDQFCRKEVARMKVQAIGEASRGSSTARWGTSRLRSAPDGEQDHVPDLRCGGLQGRD
jgi:hypothetical protein